MSMNVVELFRYHYDIHSRKRSSGSYPSQHCYRSGFFTDHSFPIFTTDNHEGKHMELLSDRSNIVGNLTNAISSLSASWWDFSPSWQAPQLRTRDHPITCSGALHLAGWKGATQRAAGAIVTLMDIWKPLIHEPVGVVIVIAGTISIFPLLLCLVDVIIGQANNTR